MKKVTAGGTLVLLGIGIGMAVSAVAVHAQTVSGFATNTYIMTTASDTWARGYVAGANDTLQTIASVPEGASAEWYVQQLGRIATCLQTKGTTNSDLLAWAKYRWTISSKQYPDDNAASTMLAEACK
jgi:hypothetical protein